MADHFTYLSFIPNADVQRFVAGLALGGAFIWLSKGWGEQLRKDKAESFKSRLVPSKLDTLGVVDWLVERFFCFHDSVLGEKNRKHAPFVATIFFFILAANLIGIFPGMPAITNCIWINVAVALFVFIYFNAYGIMEHGLIGYLRHFAGPLSGGLLFLIGPMIFAAEILSTVLRPFTLNLRLYWNIKGDHILMEMIHHLLGPYSIGIASPLFVLALFVSFMQAFVFAMLTMIYVLLATEHEDEHH